jgi:hypothetical protein
METRIKKERKKGGYGYGIQPRGWMGVNSIDLLLLLLLLSRKRLLTVMMMLAAK